MSIGQEQLQQALQHCGPDTFPAAPATIGRLGERTLHAVLKSCYEPDERYHEQPVGGFVADILRPDGIIEIQTGSFYPLRRKIPEFVKLCPVTIVHPLSVQKRLWWVDPATGAVSGGRKSPRPQRPLDLLPELFWVIDWFDTVDSLPAETQLFPLTVELVLLSMQEYRLQDGYTREGKAGSHRANRVPSELFGTVTLHTAADVAKLLPTLPQQFTASELYKTLHFTRLRANAAKKVLLRLDIIQSTGEKQGRAELFSLTPKYKLLQTE